MFSYLKQLFASPLNVDLPGHVYTANMLRAILLVTGGLNLLFTPTILLFDNYKPVLAINLMMLAAQVMIWFHLRRGYVQSSSLLFCLALWAYITVGSFIFGGIQSLFPVGYLVMAFAAGILLPTKLAYTFYAVGLLHIIFFLHLEIRGSAPIPITTTELAARGMVISGIFLAVVALLTLALNNFGTALGQARWEIGERRQAEAALKQREAILQAVAFAAAHFLAALDWEQVLDTILARLGQAAGVSRVYVFANYQDDQGEWFSSQRFEWCLPTIEPQIDNPDLQHIPLAAAGFDRWIELLSQGNLVAGHVRDFPPSEQALLEPQGILSLVVVPVMVHGTWWGFVGFDHCEQQWEWSMAELEALRAAVNTLSVAIERQQAVQTLHTERDFSMQIMNTMGQGLTVYDREGRLEYVNAAMAQMIGYSPEALLGQQPFAFVTPADQTRLDAHWQERLSGVTSSYEIRLCHADGYELPVLITGTPRYQQGQIVGAIAVVTDISEQQRRQRELETVAAFSAALRVAETRAQLLPVILEQLMGQLDLAAAALVMVDPATNELSLELGRGIWATQADLAIFTSDGLSGRLVSSGQPYLNNEIGQSPDLFPPVVMAECSAAAAIPLLAQGQMLGLLWVAHQRQLGQDDLQLLTTIATIVANALQRETLREAIAAQVRQIQVILDTVPEGVLLLDGQRKVVLANPAAAHILTFLAHYDLAQRLTHLSDLPLAQILTSPSTDQWHELQFQGRFYQITARPLAQAATHEADSAGQHWVLVISDVTEGRERQRYQQAQERLATVGQLAAGIAHDFNNIMGVIVLYAQLLQNIPGLSKRQQTQLETIRTQADRATHLVQQILDFSRRSIIQRTPIDLLPLVKETMKLLERTLPEHVRLELGYDRRRFFINADPTQMQQMLLNLAFNARDAMPQGGMLRFALTNLALGPEALPPLPDVIPGEWVVLTVQDSGGGILPHHLSHIFEPFFTTKEPGRGTGLGLAQVYGIVKQHEGAIDVSSQPDQGTLFTLYLPRLVGFTGETPLALEEDTVQGEGKTVLLVEDDQALQEATAELLEMWGFTVRCAQTGKEALEVLAGEAIDLVLSDLVMPEMGGIELSQQVREHYPQVKLLLMTGHAPEEAYAGLQQQETPWLQKPFTTSMLASKLAAVL
ncbi:MAG: GAF domain-containing protein [Anaerolineae bacterium]|nr:GAF domain-containing protein [Anaerolineae bacterium]